jgi:HAD superfamily hydrolase (TIGR01509 family)
MPHMLTATIFDLDGVLADSEPWWTEIDAKLLAGYGATYRGEYHQNVLGVSYRLAVEFYKKAFDLLSVPADEMMRRRAEIATEFFANRIGLFPTVKDVLEELRQMKLHLAVATSSVSASARPFLDRHQLTGFFEVIVTGEEVEHGKPAPDIYLRAAEKIGIPTDACLVIEDALPGVAAGKAAKMRVAAIPDQRFVDPGVYEKEADYVLGSLKELPALVRKELNGAEGSAT